LAEPDGRAGGVGVARLPFGITVEIEAIVEVE
jgi:hypothetical protein